MEYRSSRILEDRECDGVLCAVHLAPAHRSPQIVKNTSVRTAPAYGVRLVFELADDERGRGPVQHACADPDCDETGPDDTLVEYHELWPRADSRLEKMQRLTDCALPVGRRFRVVVRKVWSLSLDGTMRESRYVVDIQDLADGPTTDRRTVDDGSSGLPRPLGFWRCEGGSCYVTLGVRDASTASLSFAWGFCPTDDDRRRVAREATEWALAVLAASGNRIHDFSIAERRGPAGEVIPEPIIQFGERVEDHRP